jgi:hypothetical protein
MPSPARAVDRLTAETIALFGARRAVGHMGACVIHTSVPRILAQLARSENAAIRTEAARLADEIDRP